jgi:microcin C transport system permease protein
MRDYFIRRLLLVPITLLGATLAVYLVISAAPGGPLEAALQQAAQAASEGGRAGREDGANLDERAIEQMASRYGYDRGLVGGYLTWLGILPKEDRRAIEPFPEGEDEVAVRLPGTLTTAIASKDGALRLAPDHQGSPDDLAGWQLRVEDPAETRRRWQRTHRGLDPAKVRPEGDSFAYRAAVFQPRYAGIVQLDLGESTLYNEPVWTMIRRVLPVSIYFGIVSFIVTYGVCIPLGIVKALRHRSAVDNVTSVLVFAGYAVPGYALGALLLMWFGSNLGWFPISDFTSPNFDELNPLQKALDVLHHTALPLVCYLVGSFAFLTMLVKNNLMDQLAADYVRTATAKGVTYRSAILRHALRNSLIPVATTFGRNILLILTGSILIEQIFNINGFGLLSYSALLERDTPVVMGTVALSALLLVIGNLLSDLAVASIDPRVSFK